MRLKKRSHKVIVSLLLSTSLHAKTPQFKQQYLSRFEAIAVREMKRSGIPASITLAQGILESGWGKSPLAKASKNHFGIKCHSDWQGDKYHTSKENSEEELTTDVNSVCYRSYAIAEESYKDHTDFLLQNPKYRSLFTSTKYNDWATGLEACGYANDNSYAEALCEVIEDNKLYRLDIEITSEYSAEELMAMPTPELMQYLRFEIFNTAATDTLEMPIVDADWTALNKAEKKWFNMGLQPITSDSNRRRKTEKRNINWDTLFWS